MSIDPKDYPPAPAELEETPDPTTWAPIDLTDALGGADVPPPVILHRTDGVPLLYAGRTHQFLGESESCKSWAAQVAVAEVLRAGEPVLYIDYEDDERGVVSRLLALLVPADVIRAGLTYLRPDEPLMTRDGRATQGAVDLGTVLEARRYALAVIDGVTEAMTTEGLDPMGNADVALWSRRLPKRIANQCGSAVLVIDHVAKGSDTAGRFAIGGQHKLSGLSGASYRFDVQRPFSRAMGADPVTGAIKVTVTKDRPGYVRGHAADKVVGIFELTSYPDASVTASLRPAGEAKVGPDMALVERVLDYLHQYDGASKSRIEQDVEGRAENIRQALRWLTEQTEPMVRIERVGNSHRHYLTEAGRNA